MKKEGTGKIAKILNRISRAILTAKTATRILTCSVGRFCLFGYYFWTRPKSSSSSNGDGNDSTTLEAQRVLIMLGSQLQRFRGVVKLPTNVMMEDGQETEYKNLNSLSSDDDNNSGSKHQVNLLQIISTSADDDNSNNSPLLTPKISSSSRKNTKNNNNNDDDDDLLLTNGLSVQKGSDTWSAKVSPFYLLISWISGGFTGFLSGVSLAKPDLCPTFQKIIMVINILCMLIFIWLRPFVVPLKNYSLCLMEIVTTLSSILVAAFLFDNPFDVAESGGMDNLDFDQYHQRMSSNSSSSQLSPEEIQQRIDIASAVQVMTGVLAMVVSIIVMVSTVLRFLLLRFGRLAVVTQEEMLEMKNKELEKL